jgi:hypothetical protein
MHASSASCQEESIAEELFREGRSAMKSGDIARACASLDESQRLDPSPGTLLNLAICEEQLGHLATAWSKYRQVEDTVPPSDPRAAMARHARLSVDSKVPRIRLIADLPGPVVPLKLDGTEVGPPVLGTWMPVDPGLHRLGLLRNDGNETEADVRVGVGERVEVRLSRAFAAEPTAISTRRDSTAAKERAAGVPPLEPPHPPLKSMTPIYVAGGLAAAGFVGAGVLGTVGLAQKSTVDEHCAAHTCDAEGLRAASTGSRLLRLADVGLLVGTVSACVAGFLLWERGREKVHVTAGGNGAVLRYSTQFE